MDVLPVIRRGVGRIDAQRFDGVDRLQHTLDLGPAIHAQQAVAARSHERQRLIALAGGNRAHDIDAGDDRAEVVGRPTHEAEDAAGCKANDAAVAIENLLSDLPAEAYAMLDTLLVPGQLHMGEHGGGVMRARDVDRRCTPHGVPPSTSGKALTRSSRSMSATVTPRWNAATLMRPRSRT